MLKFTRLDLISLTKIITGLLLIAGSAFYLHQSPVKVAAQNANSYDYKTTWTATKLLTMFAKDFGPWKIALGPSDWDVTVADTNGVKVYEETWSTAMPDTGIQVDTTKNLPGAITGLDPTKWLFAINPIHVSWGVPRHWTFQKEDVSTLNLNQVINIHGMQDKVGNGSYRDSSNVVQSLASSCASDGLWCIYPTGGYGWQAEINDNSNDSTPGAVGIMMPLQWTVYGKKF